MSCAVASVAAIGRVSRMGRIAAFLLAGFIACVSFVAAAAELDGPQKAALKAAAERLVAALNDKDFDTLVDVSTPPSIMALMAAAYREPVETYRAGLIRAWRGDAARRSPIQDLAFDFDKAVSGRLSSGAVFAILPFRYTYVSSSAPKRINDSALAILDGGKSYVVLHARRIERSVLDKAYPGLAAIELPRETTEELQK